MKIFLIVIAGMLFSSGCATHWAANEYGLSHGVFSLTGPVHGNTTRLFVQGKIDVHPGHNSRSMDSSRGSRAAYLDIELDSGVTVSKNLHDGNIPPVAFEYPEITLIDNPDNKPHKTAFIESGLEMGAVSLCCFYITNPNDANAPYEIPFGDMEKYPRSTTGKILYPFVYAGAVVVDIICAPAYFVGGALVLCSVSFYEY